MNRGRRAAALDHVPETHQTTVFKLCTVEPRRYSWVPRAHPLHNTNNKYNFDSFNCFYSFLRPREYIFIVLGLRKIPDLVTGIPQILRDCRRMAPSYTRQTLDLNCGYTDFSWCFSVSSRKIPGRYRK